MTDDTDRDYNDALRSATRHARAILANRFRGDSDIAKLAQLLSEPAQSLFAEDEAPDVLTQQNEDNANRLLAWLFQHHPDLRPRPLPLFLAVGLAIHLSLKDVARRFSSSPTVKAEDSQAMLKTVKESSLTTVADVCRQPRAFLRQAEKLQSWAAGKDRLFVYAQLLVRFAGRTVADTAMLLHERDTDITPERVASMLDVVDDELAQCAKD